MGVLGGVYTNIHRRTIRSPQNPLDRSTIVSIFPIDLDENKCTIEPPNYKVPRGSFDKPSLLVVGSASWWRELDDEQPLLEIPVSSIQVADSVVKDYCNGILMCDMDTRMPGLFFVPGEFDLNAIKTKYKMLLEAADRKQKEWFRALINLADVAWNRTQGNPLSVSDLQRMAAEEMNVKGKPWMANYSMEVTLSNCPACGTLVNTKYPMCSNCKAVINEEAFKALGLKFAQ